MKEEIHNLDHMTYDNSGNSSAVAIVAVILLVIIGVLFVIYALPMLRQAPPANNENGIEIQIPDNNTEEETPTP